MTAVTPVPRTASSPRSTQVVHTAAAGPAALTVTVRRRTRTTELRLDGELDATTWPLLDCLVTDVLGHERDELVLDVAGTSFCDVLGLNCLLATRRRVQARGGRLTLVGAAALLQRLLRLSGAGDVIGSRR